MNLTIVEYQCFRLQLISNIYYFSKKYIASHKLHEKKRLKFNKSVRKGYFLGIKISNDLLSDNLSLLIVNLYLPTGK